MKMLALITQLAISMLTAILICGVLGYFVDYLFGTNLFIFFLMSSMERTTPISKRFWARWKAEFSSAGRGVMAAVM